MAVTLFEVNEGGTAVYTATIKDQTGTPIPSASLTSLRMTLYSVDSPTEAIINNRNFQDVKNVNGGTVTPQGVFTMIFSSADNTIVDITRQREHHRALFEITWSGGQDFHQVNLIIRNLTRVS